MRFVSVADLSDPGLDVYVRLTEPQRRSRRHPADGVFIAESAPVIGCALDAGCQPVSALVSRKHRDAPPPVLGRMGEIPIYTAEDAVLRELTGYRLTRGMLCAMRRPAERPPETVLSGARRLAVLEDIVDSTNLGAIFRSAAALGMDGVLLSPSCADPLSRRACRVSMGSVFQIPWARLDRWPEAGLAWLKAAGFATAALALRADSLPVSDPRLKREPRLAVLLGTEGHGLREETILSCDHTVRIPMAHGVDSLNVAAAAAVAFWELR